MSAYAEPVVWLNLCRIPRGYVTWWFGDLNPELPTQTMPVTRLRPRMPVEYAEPTAELILALLDGLRRLR